MPALTAIVLESQMTGPLRTAAARAGVELDIFLLHDFDEAAFRQSVRRADAVFGGVLTLDEPVRRVAAVLAEERPPTVAIFHSQAEALALSRIGDFDAATPAWREAVSVLREAGATLPGLLNVFLAALPQVEHLLPGGRFQGLRQYARALRLWQDGSVGALVALLQLLSGQSVTPHSPVPPIGLWHPRGGYFAHLPDYQDWYGPGSRPAVGVIVHRRWVAGENSAHFAAVIEQLEAQGLAVYAGYSDLDATHLLEGFFRPAGVECLLNLVSFNLVGGHGRPDPARAGALLESFDRPYLCSVPLVLQTLEQWRASRSGLAPHQTVMQVVMPELEGGAEPWVYAGTADGQDTVVADPEQAERLARRVRRWIDLRRAPRAERKVAVTIFSMPPDKGSVGSAAYLDVFASLWRLLGRLRAEGYRVELPSSAEELRRLVLGADTALPGAESIHVTARLPVGEYKRLVPDWRRIARCWGPPPGLVDADGISLAIRGRAFGNVFVGVQPPFGYEGDPMRLLFHPDASPSHSFAAYYAWVGGVWGAHALLHFGTHGALEFMPGRQVGLGGDDFPSVLLGDLPHFYYYSLNNPSEATIAKRRGGAVIVSHLTPPLSEAGLYRRLSAVRDAVRSSAPLAVVASLAAEACLDAEVPPGDGYRDRLAAYLLELETRLIPVGLHVAGETAGLEETARAAAALGGDGDAVLSRARASDELGALVRALDGRFIAPAPGGDPVRDPAVLPAGRNIHALNPWAVPSPVAIRTGRALAEQLLAKMGRVPESVAMVLWGTDNIKTQGEAVAQAFWLMGAIPEADSLGRMTRVRLAPLSELGRPRVDVVITCSGIFRDLFPSVMHLLDQAVLAAALADEPFAANHVRGRALTIAAQLGIPLEQAARRVFAARPDQYGTGVNHVVQESAWEDGRDLGRTYVERMSHAYGRGDSPSQEGDVLRAALSGVDAAVQHMDSVELGLADIDHYFEHLGGISAAVASLRGGARPEAYVFDTAAAGGKARTLQDALRIESRTRLLNPRWQEGMLKHGYQGVHEIAQRLDHTYGWQATAGAVDGWVFTDASRMLQEQAARMAALNPQAVHRMAGRLLEAHERGLWEGPAADVAALRDLRNGVEAMMEGIA